VHERAIPPDRRLRFAARLVAVIGLALLAATTLFVANLVHPIWFGDADWYATAVSALGGGHALYPADYLAPHMAVRPPQFNQPPAVALLSPLAALGRGWWGATMLLALVAGLTLLWPRLREPWGFALAGALIIWIPVPDAVIWANLNSVVFLLVVIAARWPRQAGWAIGLATALRLFPLFLFAWLVGRRDWRGLLVGLAVAVGLTLAAALVTQPSAIWDFILVRWYEQPTSTFGGLSIASTGLPAWVGYLVALGLAAIAAWRGSLAVAILASLAAVPTLHAHYWILVLAPLLRIGSHPYAVRAPGLRGRAPAARTMTT
jgi:hypothetical protein